MQPKKMSQTKLLTNQVDVLFLNCDSLDETQTNKYVSESKQERALVH